MTTLVLTTLMSLPLYPLNPSTQDTVNSMNLHVTVGVDGPGAVVSGGPEFTAKYEWLFEHPFILRAAYEYRYGSVNSTVYPEGAMHRSLIAAEALYYRGTDKLTGYIGLGVVYSINQFSVSNAAADSLFRNFSITDVSVSDVLGARITAGLRFAKSYSIEIGITEIRPNYNYTLDFPDDSYAISTDRFRFNDFRVTVGYLFQLRN